MSVISTLGSPQGSLSHPPGLWEAQTPGTPAQAPRPTASWASGYNHSRLLFCPQHTSTLGSVFGDAYYEQQMTARQANALSRQVSGCPGLTALPAPCCQAVEAKALEG